jgi:hypothetical protein
VFLLAITGTAQSLEIANIVTARCEGDNPIDRLSRLPELAQLLNGNAIE